MGGKLPIVPLGDAGGFCELGDALKTVVAENIVGHVEVRDLDVFSGLGLREQDDGAADGIFLHTETTNDLFDLGDGVGIKRRQRGARSNPPSLVRTSHVSELNSSGVGLMQGDQNFHAALSEEIIALTSAFKIYTT